MQDEEKIYDFIKFLYSTSDEDNIEDLKEVLKESCFLKIEKDNVDGDSSILFSSDGRSSSISILLAMLCIKDERLMYILQNSLSLVKMFDEFNQISRGEIPKEISKLN